MKMSKRTTWPLVAAAGVIAGARRVLAGRDWYRGKVVLVTGGSRGLGLILARQLVSGGAQVAVCARDESELERVRWELGRGVLCVQSDVSNPEQAQALVEETVRRFGRLDVLVNNAGIIQVAPLASLGLHDFREAMETNFFGLLHTTLAALPFLKQSRGRVVNITSIGGAVAVPHMLPYTASKFAAVGFSEGLRAEAARDGVTVTTILPGVLRTGSFLQARFKGQSEKEFAWFATSSSVPVASVAAGRAARRILLACARGEAFVTIGAPAKLLRLLHAVLPGTTGAVLSLANRLLPAPGGAGPGAQAEPGWMHRSVRGALTRLGDEAALRNGELTWGNAGPAAR